ncbi:IS3 family transposase, partial [Streptomyces sp. NPDC002573]|uniref:IS3 family transposase n=1 Tax=Streptomyces sp. NPDC002573 TaxID=3364651 RepID=UPI0036A29867
GPWTGINDIEIAVAEYIDWFNQRRLHGELGHITPAEHEAAHYLAAEPPYVTPENQLTQSPRNPGLDTSTVAVLVQRRIDLAGVGARRQRRRGLLTAGGDASVLNEHGRKGG